LLAGLESPETGQLRLRGEEIASAEASESRPPEERDVGLVFQDFALFPHLTVSENVAFGLSSLEDADREARVDELLELVDLAGRGEAYPDTLSGGQKQRVALARSLAPEPDILLLDEPLSNLDVRLRVSMREEVHRILAEAGVTAIWVTHDQEEALSIADRVGIVHDGRLHQIGRPEGVFERPATRFVASFLGQAGFLAARVENGRLATDVGPIDRDVLDEYDDRGGLDATEGAEVDVLVRPDDLRVTPATEGHAHGWIVRRQYRGPSFVYRVETTGGDVLHCLHNHTESFDVGQAVRIELVAGHRLAWYPREKGRGDGADDRSTESEVETDAQAVLDR
jgi:iron(III) transport system ATP-binding protein